MSFSQIMPLAVLETEPIQMEWAGAGLIILAADDRFFWLEATQGGNLVAYPPVTDATGQALRVHDFCWLPRESRLALSASPKGKPSGVSIYTMQLGGVAQSIPIPVAAVDYFGDFQIMERRNKEEEG